jgi:hypothetical protein
MRFLTVSLSSRAARRSAIRQRRGLRDWKKPSGLLIPGRISTAT